MKRIYSSLIASGALLVSLQAAQAQSTFPDVPDNHWAAAAVKRLAELGIVQGYLAAEQTKTKTAQAVEVPAQTKPAVTVKKATPQNKKRLKVATAKTK